MALGLARIQLQGQHIMLQGASTPPCCVGRQANGRKTLTTVLDRGRKGGWAG